VGESKDTTSIKGGGKRKRLHNLYQGGLGSNKKGKREDLGIPAEIQPSGKTLGITERQRKFVQKRPRTIVREAGGKGGNNATSSKGVPGGAASEEKKTGREARKDASRTFEKGIRILKGRNRNGGGGVRNRSITGANLKQGEKDGFFREKEAWGGGKGPLKGGKGDLVWDENLLCVDNRGGRAAEKGGIPLHIFPEKRGTFSLEGFVNGEAEVVCPLRVKIGGSKNFWLAHRGMPSS